MKKKIVIILLLLNLIFIMIPSNIFSKDSIKLAGWWVGDTCVCPIYFLIDCSCIIPKK